MGKFVKGDIVVLPFPFSDLSGSKRRPALVLAKLTGNDVLLCQITSQASSDSISLVLSDFTSGSLPVDSHIKYAKLFTADEQIFIKKAGHIKTEIVKEVIQNVVDLIKV